MLRSLTAGAAGGGSVAGSAASEPSTFGGAGPAGALAVPEVPAAGACAAPEPTFPRSSQPAVGLPDRAPDSPPGSSCQATELAGEGMAAAGCTAAVGACRRGGRVAAVSAAESASQGRADARGAAAAGACRRGGRVIGGSWRKRQLGPHGVVVPGTARRKRVPPAPALPCSAYRFKALPRAPLACLANFDQLRLRAGLCSKNSSVWTRNEVACAGRIRAA